MSLGNIMKQPKKAVALLAGFLGLASVATPIQTITNTVEQVQFLAHQQGKEKEIFEQLQSLTKNMQQVNDLLEIHLAEITAEEYQQLKTLKLVVDYCFDLIRHHTSEELAYTTYNKPIRAFSAEKQAFSMLIQQVKERIEGSQTITGLVPREELNALGIAVKTRWENAIS